MIKAGREFQFEGMEDGGAPSPYLLVLSKKLGLWLYHS